MVEVSRKTVARTSAASSGVTSARKVCAGRPFFIRIGVSQASSAPAASTAVITSGHSRGSRSSTLVSRTSRSSTPSPLGATVAPTNSRSTLAWPSGSRPPAPTPTARVVIGGCGPYDVASVVSSAAPVGVQSSVAGAPGGPAYDGTPVSSAATAGGGTGRVPCALLTVPEPTAIGVTTTSVAPRWTKPAQTPTTSAIASRAPTSWKCTSSGSLAVHGALGDGEPLEDPDREVAHRVGQRGAEQQPADVAPGPVVGRSRRPRRGSGWRRSRCASRPRPAARPARGRRRRPPAGAPRSARRRRAGRRAACRRWPPTRRRPRATVIGRLGPPGRRTRPRRSRCRC